MATAYRISRHNVSIGGAQYDMGWTGFDLEEFGGDSVEAGVQLLKNGTVINSTSQLVGGANANGELYNLAMNDTVFDTVLDWRARASGVNTGIKVSSLEGFKSYAQVAAAQTPTSSAITPSSATIACDYTPNVVESTCSAQLQYKKTTDVAWTNAGSPQATGGSSQINISRGITGLQASTQYQVRLVITRTTVNEQSLTSAVHSFTTTAGVPIVTTNAATGVSHNAAVLNGTLDINDGINVNVYFKWGTDNPPTQNQTANQLIATDGTFQQAITGLAASTTYFFQAFASFSTPAGSPVSGSVLSFTTPANPAVAAAQEDHVFVQEFNERKYGVASTFYFSVASPAATSSDRFFNAASPFVAGDVQVSKDGGAFANVGTLPTRIGATAVFSLSLTAAEMQGRLVIVQFVDQDGPAYRDMVLLVSTRWEQGNADVDASQLSNVSGFKVTGQGTGHGIEAISGATGKDISGILGSHVLRESLIGTGGANPILDSGASSSDDFYNEMLLMIVGGTAAGQARIIKDYNGTTKAVTPNRAWSTNPATGDTYLIIPGSDAWNVTPAVELAALPTFNSGFGAMLQLLFQRFAYKIEQTATTQTWRKADASTAFVSRSASDDGSTQILGMLT